jgi:hypothetical protein
LLKAGGNSAEAIVEFESRGVQGWAAIVSECTTHGRTGAPYNVGFRVASACETPFDGAYPADPLFQCFLGMAVGFVNGLGCLAEVMKVTQLVRHIGKHLRNGTADGQLAIRNDSDNGHRHVLTHGLE